MCACACMFVLKQHSLFRIHIFRHYPDTLIYSNKFDIMTSRTFVKWQCCNCNYANDTRWHPEVCGGLNKGQPCGHKYHECRSRGGACYEVAYMYC